MTDTAPVRTCADWDHPFFGDDGDEGRCECGYKVFPKGGPVAQRLVEEGFETATKAIREWVSRGTISGPNLVSELRFWLDYWDGPRDRAGGALSAEAAHPDDGTIGPADSAARTEQGTAS